MTWSALRKSPVSSRKNPVPLTPTSWCSPSDWMKKIGKIDSVIFATASAYMLSSRRWGVEVSEPSVGAPRSGSRDLPFGGGPRQDELRQHCGPRAVRFRVPWDQSRGVPPVPGARSAGHVERPVMTPALEELVMRPHLGDASVDEHQDLRTGGN